MCPACAELWVSGWSVICVLRVKLATGCCRVLLCWLFVWKGCVAPAAPVIVLGIIGPWSISTHVLVMWLV